jgi:glycosyltransferase involved in cell wall biosynthesis
MKALILHFRSAPSSPAARNASPDASDSAGTDGVSLEIMKRQALLESMGHEVAICSAYDWADLPVPALEFDREDVAVMVANLFSSDITHFTGEKELEQAFGEAVEELRGDLERAVRALGPDLMFVHNVLSLPVHPVATVSLTQLLADLRLPCVAIHHDVLSEGAYKFVPSCDFAASLLQQYFPPKMQNLSHWTINTRNQRALEARGIQVGVIYDSMDFEHRLDATEHARLRDELRVRHGIDGSDVVLIVGARIVPNKQIELAGHVTAALQLRRREMVGRMLYNGEVFDEASRVVLVLAGRPERGFAQYQDRLSVLLDSLEVDWMYVGDEVRPQRVPEEGWYALYPDMYSMADFVLYPSGWEGFGNQLLEAFAAGLPVVAFEYPVFREDIAPKGVKVISLGQRVLQERGPVGLVQLAPEVVSGALQRMVTLLTDQKQYSQIVNHNTAVGRRFFSFDVLRTHLSEALLWAKRSAEVEHTE